MDVQNVAEEWRAIAGFPLYEVSSAGRVRSWNARGRRRETPLVLSPRLDSKGYDRVHLNSLGTRTERFVHHIVLETFVGPRPAGTEGRHLNGIRADNSATNLEWASHAANMRDQYKHGTRARGSRHGMAKLHDADVVRIRAIVAEGWRQCDVAAEYGISRATVCNIVKRKKWQHI